MQRVRDNFQPLLIQHRMTSFIYKRLTYYIELIDENIVEKLIILNTKYAFHSISNYLFYQLISKGMLSEWYTFIYGQNRN